MYVIALGLVHLCTCICVFSMSELVCMSWLLALCICVFVFVYLCIWHVWVSLYVMATRPCASCQSICPLTQSWSQLVGTTWRRCLFRDLSLSCVKTTLICDGLEFGVLIIVNCKGRRLKWRHRTNLATQGYLKMLMLRVLKNPTGTMLLGVLTCLHQTAPTTASQLPLHISTSSHMPWGSQHKPWGSHPFHRESQPSHYGRSHPGYQTNIVIDPYAKVECKEYIHKYIAIFFFFLLSL